MNAIVEEWIAKADADFGTASREAAVVDHTNHDAVCFHAQQCVEKLFKAAMIAAGHTPPRLHDLAVLSRMLEDLVPGWSWPDEEMRFLTRAAVEYRYPGRDGGRRRCFDGPADLHTRPGRPAVANAFRLA